MGTLIAYEDGERGYKSVVRIEGDTENLAAFVASRNPDPNSRYIVTDVGDTTVLTTIGNFIDVCADKEFLVNELQPAIIPMQLGTAEIPEVRYIDEESIEQEKDDEFELGI